MSLVWLAPDIQKAVARLTTTTASNTDRKKLELVAEPVKWPGQRARFQKVMDEVFGVEPAPVARTLAHAIKLPEDIRAKRISMKRVAAARETSVEELREYLVLAKLAHCRPRPRAGFSVGGPERRNAGLDRARITVGAGVVREEGNRQPRWPSLNRQEGQRG